jgi:hypothetical protein
MTTQSNRTPGLASVVTLATLGVMAENPAQAFNLVINGNFATGNLSGWTQSGDTSFTQVIRENTLTGSGFALEMGPATPGVVSQGISPGLSRLLIQQSYDFSFDWMVPFVDGDSFLIASFDGITLFTTAASVQPWTHEAMTFNAQGGNALLQFTAENAPDFYHLTNISITPVPEAPVPVLLSYGLLVSWCARRLRRRHLA